MKTLAHLSDLHFGREDPELVEALLRSVEAARPQVIVVSGDFTQRAKKKQFRAARAFLRRLPSIPQVVVPGNHDVSTTNLVERAMRPLARYKRYISPDLAPFYQDEEVAIAGINTVRLLATKDGRISLDRVSQVCTQFMDAPSEAIRIVVTHHPLDLPSTDLKNAIVTRARAAMESFSRCGPGGVDLFLSGHLHGGLTLASSARYPMGNYSAVVAHAGTAVSTRTRDEPNAWNLIELASTRIDVHQMSWTGEGFRRTNTDAYRRTLHGWAKANSGTL